MSAVQTYYLSSEFPNAKILFLKDFINKKNNILDMEFDFLILPFWEIEKIPENCINLIINIRSMMEMKLNTINFYFKNINRIISNKGLFVCFNRYQKNNQSKEIFLSIFPEIKYYKRLDRIGSLEEKLRNNYDNDLLLGLMIVDQSNNYEYFCHKYKTSNNIIKKLMKNYPPIR